MEPGLPRAIRPRVFHPVLCSATPHRAPTEGDSARSHYHSFFFWHKDDILSAPEKQFVFGKLQMKHLPAESIWGPGSGSDAGRTLRLAAPPRCDELGKCVFYGNGMAFQSKAGRRKHEEADHGSTCVCSIPAKAPT